MLENGDLSVVVSFLKIGAVIIAKIIQLPVNTDFTLLRRGVGYLRSSISMNATIHRFQTSQFSEHISTKQSQSIRTFWPGLELDRQRLAVTSATFVGVYIFYNPFDWLLNPRLPLTFPSHLCVINYEAQNNKSSPR